jgi:RNA recognition motif-containing protein
MSDDAAAKTAITQLDGGTVEGRAIRVSEAKPREDRPARSGNSSRPDHSRGYNNSTT